MSIQPPHGFGEVTWHETIIENSCFLPNTKQNGEKSVALERVTSGLEVI